VNARSTVKKIIPRKLFRRIEPYGHLIEAVAVATIYGRPAKNMRVIGITGTNGKTTTAFMVHTMLTEAGYSVGLMTTVANGVGNDIQPQIAHMTTVSSPQLNKRLKEFKRKGVEWVVLETTSHALAQHRVWGVNYEVAVLTNITHEHLDYHRTFEEYVRAKKRLFEIANRNKNGFGIINADDPTAGIFQDAIVTSETYGVKSGDIRAENIDLQSDKSIYTAKSRSETYDITCHIPGEFNVQNSLAAISVGRHLGLSKHQIEQGIAALKTVEGRMMAIDEGQAYTVIVDFAHTPDSFERLLSNLRTSTKGKLVVLFGSAGRRDESKRATQGEIAGKYADELVLTEEDDRDIDGNEILAQIAEGAVKSGKTENINMFLVLDRAEAIAFAVGCVADKNDTLVLLGKGHEKTIERADGEHPWDEITEVKKAISSSR
jgi:UDP-N-acetylmuramoyl-L-alanyl-D-glutamate--2,6-diaminopimelate ligase